MRSLFTCLVILFPVVAVFAQTKDIEALRQINVDLNNATVAKDTAAQCHIFADDMLLTNPAGETYNKQQLLKRWVAGPGLLSLRTMSAGFADRHCVCCLNLDFLDLYNFRDFKKGGVMVSPVEP